MQRPLWIRISSAAILPVLVAACAERKSTPEPTVSIVHASPSGQPNPEKSSLDDGLIPVTPQTKIVDEQGCKTILAGKNEPSELTQTMIDIYCSPPDSTLAVMTKLYDRAIDQIIDEQDPYSSHDRYVEARANVQKLKDSAVFNEVRQDRTTSLNVRFNERVSGIRDQLFRDHLKTGIVMAGVALVAGGLAGKAAYIRQLIGFAPELMPSAGVVADVIGDTFVGSASKVPNAVLNAGTVGAVKASRAAVGIAARTAETVSEALAFTIKKPAFVAKRLIRGGLNPADAAFLKFDLFTGKIPDAAEFAELNLPGLSYAKIAVNGNEKNGTQFLVRYSRTLGSGSNDLIVASRTIGERDLANYESRLAQLAERNRNTPVVVEMNPATQKIEVLDTPAAALMSVTEPQSGVAVTESIVDGGSAGAINPALKKFDYLAGGFVTLGVGTAEAVAFKLGEPFGRREARVPEDLYLDSVVPVGSSTP